VCSANWSAPRSSLTARLLVRRRADINGAFSTECPAARRRPLRARQILPCPEEPAQSASRRMGTAIQMASLKNTPQSPRSLGADDPKRRYYCQPKKLNAAFAAPRQDAARLRRSQQRGGRSARRPQGGRNVVRRQIVSARPALTLTKDGVNRRQGIELEEKQVLETWAPRWCAKSLQAADAAGYWHHHRDLCCPRPSFVREAPSRLPPCMNPWI